MRSALLRAAAALLALLMLAALTGCGDDGQPTQVTPIPKTSMPPSPTPGFFNTSEPQPTPETHAPTLADAVGSWELYSSEVEGEPQLAADTCSRIFLNVRDCARADFVEMPADDETAEQLNCPIRTEDGRLLMELPEDIYGRVCEFVRADAQELELSVTFENPDGTPGGSTLLFHRLQEPDTEFRGTALTPDALRALNVRANSVAENGFFRCTFVRPQEIDWNEVLRDGAEIGCEPGDEALAEYSYYSDVPSGGSVLCVSDSALRAFVWAKTLTSYSEAERQIWADWYESSDGYYFTQPCGKCLMPVALTAAYADGEIFQLHYARTDRSDPDADPVPFVMTVRIRGDEWQYISNQREDAPRAVLLTVDYFGEEEELPDCFCVTEYVDTEVSPSDEPSWVRAVLTAREDGVRYRIDHSDTDYPEADLFLVSYLDRYIGDNVCSGVLQAGESVVVKVNTPWYPTFRVTAVKDTLYGEMWFGEQNMLHIFDLGARFCVVGSDADAEGRGCSPRSERELTAFLCDGDWFWCDPDTCEPRALLCFPDGYCATLESGELYHVFDSISYVFGSGAEAGAPDILRLSGDAGGSDAWDYYWTAYQMDGEQILCLTQADGAPGVLNGLLPGAAADETEFLFVRFNGAALEEGQG